MKDLPVVTLHRTLSPELLDIRRESCHIGFLHLDELGGGYVELDNGHTPLTMRDLLAITDAHARYSDLHLPGLTQDDLHPSTAPSR
jgi:hypothetical protein